MPGGKGKHKGMSVMFRVSVHDMEWHVGITSSAYSVEREFIRKTGDARRRVLYPSSGLSLRISYAAWWVVGPAGTTRRCRSTRGGNQKPYYPPAHNTRIRASGVKRTYLNTKQLRLRTNTCAYLKCNVFDTRCIYILGVTGNEK